MSFNKRFYSEKSLLDYAKTNGFDNFERYIMNRDSSIYEDEFSSTFCRMFESLKPKSDERLSLYEILKNRNNEK